MSESSSQRWWIVRRSSIHQRGIFARRDIPKETPVIEYIGEKITKAESERRGQALIAKAEKTGGAAVYIFTLNKRQDLDGAKPWNTARLINHSCDPNCESFVMRGKVWIYSKRDIQAGEELTFNYGFGLETWEDHPCRCGAARCIGYILDEQFWPALRRTLKARAARKQKLADLAKRAKALKKELRDTAAKPAPKKKTSKRSRRTA